jgi:hypothetical protein
LEEAFAAQGKVAHVYTDPSILFRQIENGGKGVVLISRNVRHPMARIIPDFLVGRFHLPVILFQESFALPLAFQKEAITTKQQIVQLDGGFEAVLDFTKDFEKNYLAEIDPSLNLPKVRSLRMTSRGVFEKLHTLFDRKKPNAPSMNVQIASFKIRDPKGLGYFVFGIPIRKGGPASQSQIDEIQSFLKKSLSAEIEIQVMRESVKYGFFKDLRENSELSVSGEMQGLEMVALYFNNLSESNLQKEFSFNEQLALVPVEDWWMKLPLPCNTYIWLNKSGRKILYVRASARMSEQSYDRFQKKGVSHLSISLEDVPQFQGWRELISLTKPKDSTLPIATAA